MRPQARDYLTRFDLTGRERTHRRRDRHERARLTKRSPRISHYEH